MTIFRFGLGAAVVSCALACTASKPEINFAWDQQARFEKAGTFAWYADPNFEMPHGGSIVDGRFVDEHVRKAVEDHLRDKGIARAAGDSADIYVSYNTSPAGVVSQDKFGSYSWWSPTIWVGTKYAKEGTLVLDIRDREKKLVWRGVITMILGTNPEAVARDIDHAAGKLLDKYPPPPGTAPPPIK